MIGNGEFKRSGITDPFALGDDVAGVVTRLGSAVRDPPGRRRDLRSPRDLRIGTFVEYIAIDPGRRRPEASLVTLHEAAAVQPVSLAAGRPRHRARRAEPRPKVLVHAGSGGLGSTVIQLAKHLGAVVATTARGENAEPGAQPRRGRRRGRHEAAFADVLGDHVMLTRAGRRPEKSLMVLKPGGHAISVPAGRTRSSRNSSGAEFMGVVPGR